MAFTRTPCREGKRERERERERERGPEGEGESVDVMSWNCAGEHP